MATQQNTAEQIHGEAFPAAPIQQMNGGGQESHAVVQRAGLTTYADIEASAKAKKFQWDKLRTGMDKDDVAKAGKAKGLGVGTTAGTTLKSKITWKAVHGNAQEGQEVDATILGPDHKLGSEPQTGKAKVWNKRRAALSKEAKNQKYIAGHLLNNNLGGPGDDARNLTAIPATANTTQSSNCEEEVKTMVNEQLHFVHYKVSATYAQDTKGKKLHYASQISSEWNPLDKDGADILPAKKVTITIPSPSKVGGGTAVGLGKNATVIDTSGAAKALIDPTKDVVLNNSGYLKIATQVQKTFVSEISKLAEQLEEAQAATITSEEERERCVEQIDELKEELEETTQLLGQTQTELQDTLSRLDQSTEENRNLASALQELQEQYARSQAEVARLKEEVAQLKAKLKSLKKEKKALEISHISSEIGRAAALDLLHQQQHSGELEEGLEEFSLVLLHSGGQLQNLREGLAEFDRRFSAFKQKMEQSQKGGGGVEKMKDEDEGSDL
ncbi:MAG TPA: DNA/RNA non-specific endonuclease [Alphaproteobacteria bacterium]|nr:DNA/RNA non-specific endonuclease [Alphaproteobacteria bacterium]